MERVVLKEDMREVKLDILFAGTFDAIDKEVGKDRYEGVSGILNLLSSRGAMAADGAISRVLQITSVGSSAPER